MKAPTRIKSKAEVLKYCRDARIEVRLMSDRHIVALVTWRFPEVNERTIAATLRHQATNYNRLYTYVQDHCGTDDFRVQCYRIIRRKADGAISPIVKGLVSRLNQEVA